MAYVIGPPRGGVNHRSRTDARPVDRVHGGRRPRPVRPGARGDRGAREPLRPAVAIRSGGGGPAARGDHAGIRAVPSTAAGSPDAAPGALGHGALGHGALGHGTPPVPETPMRAVRP